MLIKNDINVILKIPKRHRGPHKTPQRAACLRPLIYNLIFHV